MKKITLLFFMLPFLGLSQVQIGQDIDGQASNDYSGASVSLSSNGNIVAIGAPSLGLDNFPPGHVRIYSDDNESGFWTQLGNDIDGEAVGDRFGVSVSLSSDGNIVAIGAIGNAANGYRSGHVRIYSYDNLIGTWTQLGSDIDGEAAGDQLGTSVSLSSDGSIVAIGADSNDGNGINSGHVRIYSYDSANDVWTQLGTDIDGEAQSNHSGHSVSISSDGSSVAIGAYGNATNGYNSGHVRIYSYDNTSGVWTQLGSDINGEAAMDRSGWCVSLSSDGRRVAIGAITNAANGYDTGHVRIYGYDNTSGIWMQLGSDIDGEAVGELSGESVSLSSDGSIVAIGSPFYSGNGTSSGYVRIYNYNNLSDVWMQIGSDINGEAIDDNSGISVSLSSNGNTVAIGATSNDDNGQNSGHIRVYDISNFTLNTDKLYSSQLSFYPNPTKNQFTIQLDPSVSLEQVNIYNFLGQIVLTSVEKMVDTSKLSSGSYVVEIETNKGKSSKKLIIE